MKKQLTQQEQKAYNELINDFVKHLYKGTTITFREVLQLIIGYEKSYKEEGYKLNVTKNVVNNVLIELVANANKYY